jgi:hypothetical protein
MPRPARDLTGLTLGRLRVIRREKGCKRLSYFCICECGSQVVVNGSNLMSKYSATKSCGCLQREKRVKHGGWKLPEYGIWSSMKSRCNVPATKYFENYGGRGIKVCEAWMNSFAQFIADMGPRPSSRHSIERRNNDGDYEPGNCFWSTRRDQMRNTRQNHLITYGEKTQCLTAWAEELGMEAATLFCRVGPRYQWSVEKAFETPVIPRSRRRK